MRRAPIKRKKNKTGRRSVNVCTKCNKTAYDSEEHAVTGVGAILRSAYILSRPYYNEECGWWHITKQVNGTQQHVHN